MNRHSSRFRIAVLLLLAGTLAGCDLPTKGGDCEADELSAVVNMQPRYNIFIDTLTPVLSWEYHGECEPDSFHVWLNTPHGTEDVTVDAETTSWSPGLLEPATHYSWFVEPVSGSTVGDWANAEFRTGPMCDPTDPAVTSAPALLSPADGAVITETVSAVHRVTGEVLSTGFTLRADWEAPSGCLVPYGYRLEVARSASFAPSTSMGWIDDYKPPTLYWSLWREWHDCERYFWRVSPLLDWGVVGPASETRSFIVNTTGTWCPPELGRGFEPWVDLGPSVDVHLTGHGAIAGHVFHDECATPYETPEVAPPGCILMPDGSIEANGVLDPGDEGIEGVTVRLDDGPCPIEDGWTATTDANGQFGFRSLTAGTYCLAIDPAADGNDSVLIPGHWTMPYRWTGPGAISIQVTLASNDDISRRNDFGWDYQFLPSSGTPFARVLTDARCRRGPGFDYPTLTYFAQGAMLPIIGRLQQGGWWQVDAPNLDEPCWIGEPALELLGDLSNVPLATPPPAPTPTPTEEPPQQPQGCRCLENNCQYVVPCPAECHPCP